VKQIISSVATGKDVMSAQKRKSLLIAAGLVTLIISAASAALLLFDINTLKTRIEAAATEATGMEVSIKGEMGLSFFPVVVSARDIHVSGKEGEIMSLGELKLGMELLPLLQKQPYFTRCELIQPVVSIVKDAAGKYNYESSAKKAAPDQAGVRCSFNELKLSKGTVVYLNRKNGERAEYTDISLDIRDLAAMIAPGAIMQDVSFNGQLGCKEMRHKGLTLHNIKSPVAMAKKVISLTDLTMDIFGAQGAGNAMVDSSGAAALYRIDLKVSKLDFVELEKSFGLKKVIGGKGDLHASLTLQELDGRTLKGSIDGTLSLRGDNLVVYTMDLDKVLSRYEASQEFNLVDLGAFFIAGPLSAFAVKGYRSGELYSQARGGRGTITRFISHWKISAGVAQATDCALATQHNRVALKGRLDLVKERYDSVVVALLDDKGCIKISQSINGSFRSPLIGSLSSVEYFTGPISTLYRKAKRFVQSDRCEVFYNGAVQQPHE